MELKNNTSKKDLAITFLVSLILTPFISYLFFGGCLFHSGLCNFAAPSVLTFLVIFIIVSIARFRHSSSAERMEKSTNTRQSLTGIIAGNAIGTALILLYYQIPAAAFNSQPAYAIIIAPIFSGVAAAIIAKGTINRGILVGALSVTLLTLGAAYVAGSSSGVIIMLLVLFGIVGGLIGNYMK